MAKPDVISCQRYAAAWIGIAVLGFILRFSYTLEINNSINDLSARQALMSLDIVNGVYHFPNGPWILEYDEAGFAWLMAPWVMVTGGGWPAFRLFGILLTSMVPLFLAWSAARRFGLRTGFTAGLLLATTPAQLVWDRYLFMSAVSAMSILWLLAISLIDRAPNRAPNRPILAGLLVATSCYIGHYSVVIMPTIIVMILLSVSGWKKKFADTALFIAAACTGAIPLLLHHLNHPEYTLWRERHFLDFNQPLSAIMFQYLAAFRSHIEDLFWGGTECLFLRKNVPVFSSVLTVLVLVGLIAVLTNRRRSFWFVSGLVVTLYIMMGLIRVGNWSGVYHSHAMPFFILIAALGVECILSGLHRCLPGRLVMAVYVLMMTAIVTGSCYQFFWGSYSIHPRPDSLTRLQEDLADMESIPYLFSNRIHEVAHYHMPFWLATRSYQERISIFGWSDSDWVTDPDRLSFQFEPVESDRTGFVIPPDDFDELKRRIGEDLITGSRRLPSSGLLLVICRVSVPDFLQRTWTKSRIPPLLPIERQR